MYSTTDRKHAKKLILFHLLSQTYMHATHVKTGKENWLGGEGLINTLSTQKINDNTYVHCTCWTNLLLLNYQCNKSKTSQIKKLV